ncbi:MAG: hybrid sensor histidine kinase/response regulator [Leptolyngbyaceae cyanobacterium bins.302]|nr:hybrid sensor histidine kinase/response regulator [Leptolyngbyaceae cyanobacterium bins.302]
MPHFLLIDDNPGDRALILRRLQLEFPDYFIQEITNQQEFDRAIEEGKFELVITDFMLRWSDGITVLQIVKSLYPECPVIMFTGSGTQEVAVEAMKAGLDDYLVKSSNHYVRIPVAVRSALEAVKERNRTQQLATDYQTAQNQILELERLSQLKDDFLNMVSHELRIPITNMKIAIRMLTRIPNEEQRQRYIKILETECDREAELINNLLDLQRLEAATENGDATVEVASIQEWLPGLLEGFQGRVQERQQQLRVQMPNFPPLKLDHAGLKRIVAELLNNACKYTASEGHIILTGCLTPAKPDQPTAASSILTLAVRNQAEIPAAALPHIFDKFYRAPKSDPWQQGGTGLGLTLVHQLVRRMKGTIAVHSQDGWTTFTVKLNSD